METWAGKMGGGKLGRSDRELGPEVNREQSQAKPSLQVGIKASEQLLLKGGEPLSWLGTLASAGPCHSEQHLGMFQSGKKAENTPQNGGFTRTASRY